MAKPRRHDWHQMKTLARYLLGVPRVVLKFQYQERPRNLTVWTDTDHAGRIKTTRSTSGGVLLFGYHCLKRWSVNQQHVALSSGEAEYYGLVRGVSQALGLKGTYQDLGVQLSINAYVDASVAVGIAHRRGLGKVRHIELDELWLQSQVARGRVRVYKVPGDINLADSLTKHSTAEKVAMTMRHTGGEVRSGRHELMPNLAE